MQLRPCQARKHLETCAKARYELRRDRQEALPWMERNFQCPREAIYPSRERFLTGLLPKPEVWVRNVGGASARRPVQHSAASWPWTPTHGIPKTTAVCGLKPILFWFCVGQPPFRQLSGVVAALRHPPTFSLKTSAGLGNRPVRERSR